MTVAINPKVIDLSHYDDVQDGFKGAVNFGIRGVINKVTENVSVLDKSFAWRRSPATNAGLLFGAYHFLRPGRIQDQARWFVQNVGDPGGLLLACDFEVDGISLADVKDFLSFVKIDLGRWPVLYSYSAFLREKFTQDDIADPFWKQIRLWIAAYNTHPTWPACWDEPFLWQYTGDGSGSEPHNVPGIIIEGSKGIDINSFAGSDEELKEAWAKDLGTSPAIA